MHLDRPRIRWDFLLLWVLGSLVGFFGLFAVAFGMFMAALGPVALRTLWRAGGFAVFGWWVGLMQYAVLRQRVSKTWWWVWASTLGFVVGWALGEAQLVTVGFAWDGESIAIRVLRPLPALMTIGGVVDWAVFFAMIGAVAGITQALILRRELSWSGLWVMASVAGFASGGAIGRAVLTISLSPGSHKGIGLLELIASTVAMGCVVGLITGIALIWLLRHPVPDAFSEAGGSVG